MIYLVVKLSKIDRLMDPPISSYVWTGQTSQRLTKLQPNFLGLVTWPFFFNRQILFATSPCKKNKKELTEKRKEHTKGMWICSPPHHPKGQGSSNAQERKQKNSQIKSKPRKKLPPAKNKHKPNTITELGKRYWGQEGYNKQKPDTKNYYQHF